MTRCSQGHNDPGIQKEATEGGEKMKPCSCGHIDPAPVFIGIQHGPNNIADLALWNCRACGSTRAKRMVDATPEQRRDAINAELARLAVDGLI